MCLQSELAGRRLPHGRSRETSGPLGGNSPTAGRELTARREHAQDEFTARDASAFRLSTWTAHGRVSGCAVQHRRRRHPSVRSYTARLYGSPCAMEILGWSVAAPAQSLASVRWRRLRHGLLVDSCECGLDLAVAALPCADEPVRTPSGQHSRCARGFPDSLMEGAGRGAVCWPRGRPTWTSAVSSKRTVRLGLNGVEDGAAW